MVRVKACKVCTLSGDLKSQIEEFYQGGKGIEFIKGFLESKNVHIDDSIIHNHFEKHFRKSPRDYKKARLLECEIEKSCNVELLDFDKFLAEFGLTYSQVIDVENNLDANVTAIQAVINLLFLKNLALANQRLEECLTSDRRYPKDFINGLKALAEIHAKYLGVDVLINTNNAIRTIESQGLKINSED